MSEGDGVPHSIRPGDTLADRYRLDDLLAESGSGRFWHAHDHVLQRHVALHVIAADDERAPALLDAARRSATVIDPRILRVLDAQLRSDLCFVVNEWGYGTSLDIALANNGSLTARSAAWLVAEVADSLAAAHAHGVHHGRLVPENVLIDATGGIRIIGCCVDAAMHGLPPGDEACDLRDLGGLLHAALTGRWAGDSSSSVPGAPLDGSRVLRPRQVRAGVPKPLDDLVDLLLNPATARLRGSAGEIDDAAGIAAYLTDFVGDPTGIARSLAAANPVRVPDVVVLDQVPEIALRADEPDEPVTAVTAVGPDEPDDVGPTAPAVEEGRAPRPLFAPAPADGGPARRSRPGAHHPAPAAEAPWHRETHDTGGIRVVPDAPTHLSRPLPGRRWNLLAVAVAVVAVVVIGVLVLLSR